MSFRGTLLLVLGLLVLGLATPSAAQVGSGWSSCSFSKSYQYGGSWGGLYSNSGGVEKFWMVGTGQRSEIAFASPRYTSGNYQIQGEVNVKAGSGGTGGTGIQQVFGVAASDATAASQVRVYNVSSGQLQCTGSGQSNATLATGVYGKYVRLNVWHDANANKIYHYYAGSLKNTRNDGGNGTHYFKYGVYLRPESNPQAQWRSIKFFKK